MWSWINELIRIKSILIKLVNYQKLILILYINNYNIYLFELTPDELKISSIKIGNIIAFFADKVV